MSKSSKPSRQFLKAYHAKMEQTTLNQLSSRTDSLLLCRFERVWRLKLTLYSWFAECEPPNQWLHQETKTILALKPVMDIGSKRERRKITKAKKTEMKTYQDCIHVRKSFNCGPFYNIKDDTTHYVFYEILLKHICAHSSTHATRY